MATQSELEGKTSEALEIGGVINEQETEKRDDKRLAGDLATLFNMMDRLVMMMRVYPKRHPLLDELGDQISERFKRTFEEHEDSIDVLVGAMELKTFLETPCFSRELSDKEQFLWYSTYSDGLLRLTFTAGLTSQEIIDLMGVVNRVSQGSIGSDDDTVTLLWELDLKHVDYFAVEGFVDGGGVDTFDNMPEPEAISMVTDAAINPNGDAASKLGTMFNNLNMAHLDVFTRMHMQANAEIVTSELKDADLAYAFGVEQGTIDSLNDEWTSGIDLEYRLIEALLSIVRTSPGSTAGVKASELIKSVTEQLIDGGRYAQAARVLELLHDRRELFMGADFDPLKELIDELSDPLQLEALLYTMQKSTQHRDEIAKLMLLLGPSKVQLQILRLLADPKRKIVAIKQLIDVLLAATNAENEHQVSSKDFVESETYLRRLLNELSGREVVEFSPLPRLIRAGLGHTSVDAQSAALALDHPVFRDPTIAEKYLVPLSNNLDEDLRKRAFERLGSYHPEYFKTAIRDSVLSKQFKGRKRAELRFLMRVFLENDDEAPKHLREMLITHGWFNKSAREFAKMAAAVLVEAKDPNAAEIMQAQVGKFFTNPDLKKSYSATLERYGVVESTKLTAPEIDVSGVGDRPSDAMFEAINPDDEESDG